MRALCVLLLVAACDLQPPAKKQAPPTPAGNVTPESPKFVAPARPPELPEPAKVETTSECIDVGKHVADVFVASVTDPAQKSVFEQERTKIVKATAEACTTQQWSAEGRSCYTAANTPDEIKACESKFPAPTVQPAPAQKPNIPPGVRPDQL